jgi:hypothetical protein
MLALSLTIKTSKEMRTTVSTMKARIFLNPKWISMVHLMSSRTRRRTTTLTGSSQRTVQTMMPTKMSLTKMKKEKTRMMATPRMLCLRWRKKRMSQRAEDKTFGQTESGLMRNVSPT